MKIGFTGTRHGMTRAQLTAVNGLLDRLTDVAEAHHGDCVGADEQFDEMCRMRRFRRVIHPPYDDKLRAFCHGPDVKVLEALPYLQRNHAIVICADLMIAAPATQSEILRSGTWATIRYAQKVGRRMRIVYPDGLVIGFKREGKG